MAKSNPESWWRREGDPESGFRYLRADRRTEVRSRSGLARIDRMRIPPAWTDVHISPDAGRKLQAWGYDQAGRKQYIYSDAHVTRQDRRKWKRLLLVARLLPRIRAVTNEHLKRPELDREKVLATVVRLMCRGYFRAGSERYAVTNRTFGICTLKKRHVRVHGNDLFFSYAGKRGKHQHQVVADTPLVEIVEELLTLRGQRLFRYRDAEGKLRPVTARAVNEYLREIAQEKITSKDLRTFGGTLRAALVLEDIGPAASQREVTRNLALASRMVAHDLGNTPAICRKAYIHPIVFDVYGSKGVTLDRLPRAGRNRPIEAEEPVGHYPEELALIRFLERYG
jgi:DNA topoisomerase I